MTGGMRKHRLVKLLRSFKAEVDTADHQQRRDQPRRKVSQDEADRQAVDAFQRGDRDAAQATLFGAEHERLQRDLLATVGGRRDRTEGA